MASLVRFVFAGALNTLVGYGIILLGLWWGLGPFAANAVGFAVGIPLAYHLHRGFTFAVRHPTSWRERWRFLLAFALAYAANLGVVAAGHRLGFGSDAAVQLVAVMTYAAMFYLLSRYVVFVAPKSALP